MKSLKTLVATSVLVAGLASSAFASVSIVYIVGAPAFRQDSNTNIINLFVVPSGTPTGPNPSGVSVTSGPSTSLTDVESASANVWYLPNYFGAGQDLEINASFTGSTAGIESVAAGRSGSGSPYQQNFFKDGVGSVASPLVGQTITGSNGNNLEYPDVTLSDTYQATTPFNGTKTFYGGASNTLPFTATYGDLQSTGVQLGVEPYVFVASRNAPAALNNITTQQAQLLFKYGKEPLSFFTGNAADSTSYVYGLTRDGGSGARLGLVAEVGIGTASNLLTYKPTVTGGTTDSNGNSVGGTVAAAPGLYPAGVIPSTGIYAAAGSTGYSGFGSLLSAITASITPTNVYFITYFNLSDGAEAVNNNIGANAKPLSYNGIAPYVTTPYIAANFDYNALANGKYSFWAYQWLYASPTAGSAANTVISILEGSSNGGTGTGWVSTLPLTSLNVYRNSDGGLIQH